MISFVNLHTSEPYKIFHDLYQKALSKNQKNIEAIVISSLDIQKNEVDSRYVNLKTIEEKDFIFFSNYNSKKAHQFESNRNIAALFYWNKINTQIRMKGKIYKLDKLLSDMHFKNRLKEKNALAISSMQSMQVESFDLVKKNFLYTLNNEDLERRPEYWGGYKFIPYEFEFWVGHKYRLNQRTHFKLEDGSWMKTLLQP